MATEEGGRSEKLQPRGLGPRRKPAPIERRETLASAEWPTDASEGQRDPFTIIGNGDKEAAAARFGGASKIESPLGGAECFPDLKSFPDENLFEAADKRRADFVDISKTADGSPSSGDPTAKPGPQAVFEVTQGDPRKVALLIGLAALSGESANQILGAAATLEGLFLARAPDRKAEDAPFKIDLSSPYQTLLEPFGVEAINGEGEGQRLRLLDAASGPAIIWHALSQFGASLREDVATWLRELGSDRDQRTRIAAGRVCGSMSRYDFLAVQTMFFEPWRLAASGEPLDALDAGLADACQGAGQRLRIIRYIDEMSERADFDDVFALGALVSGVFGFQEPDQSFKVLKRLLLLDRVTSFSMALRGYIAWLAFGKSDTRFAGRAWIELDKISGDEFILRQKAYIVLSMLAKAASTRDHSPQVFQANISSEPGLAAFGRLLNFVIFLSDARIKAPSLMQTARTLAGDLFRNGVENREVRATAYPAFEAARQQGLPEQAERLTELMAAWRDRVSARAVNSATLR